MNLAVIDVVIPAHNEENAIGNVLKEIPMDIVREIVVVDNNSNDNTSEEAKNNGATVLKEKQKGYGYACLKGIHYLSQKQTPPGIIVFLDGDYSDYPEQLTDVISPIINNNIDMVIGSRALGNRERKSMTPQQIFGNWLATKMIRLFFRAKFTDLGPFRAIKFDKLLALNMEDKTYGWTVEMQVKAVKKKYTFTEVPIDYRERIGVSKVSGTVKGTILAGYKIIKTILVYTLKKT